MDIINKDENPEDGSDPYQPTTDELLNQLAEILVDIFLAEEEAKLEKKKATIKK